MRFSRDTFLKLPYNHQHYKKPLGVHGFMRHYHLHFETEIRPGKVCD